MRGSLQRPVSLPEALYARFVAIYPMHFRERFGNEMRLVFRERLRDAMHEGPLGRIRFFARMASDVVASLASEHLSANFGSPARVRRTVHVSVTTALAALAIAVLVGAYVLVDAVVLRPFPYPTAERLVQLDFGPTALGTSTDVVHRLLGDRNVFAASSAYNVRPLDAALPGETRHVAVVRTFGDLFAILGARTLLGRPLSARDAGPIVLTAATWRGDFARDPRIIGRSIRFGGADHRIVGVLADDFALPENRADIYVADSLPKPNEDDGDWQTYRTISRLRSGDTPERAQRALRHSFGKENAALRVVPLSLDDRSGAPRTIVIVFGIACAITIIALFRVGAMLAGSTIRRRITVGTVALVAGAIGAMAALTRTDALDSVPHIRPLTVGPAAAPIVIALALVVLLVAAVMRPGRRRRGRAIDVACCLAALGMTVLAVATTRDWHAALARTGDLGSSGRVLASLILEGHRYRNFAAIGAFARRLEARLERDSAFERVAIGSTSPLSIYHLNLSIDRKESALGRAIDGAYVSANPGFLELAGYHFLRGRDIRASDDARHPTVVLIDETFARAYFGTTDVIGRTMLFNGPPKLRFTIVGLLAPVRMHDLSKPPEPLFVASFAQQSMPILTIAARTSLDPQRARLEINREIAAIDPLVLVAESRSAAEVVADATMRARFIAVASFAAALTMWMLTIFSVLDRTRRRVMQGRTS